MKGSNYLVTLLKSSIRTIILWHWWNHQSEFSTSRSHMLPLIWWGYDDCKGVLWWHVVSFLQLHYSWHLSYDHLSLLGIKCTFHKSGFWSTVCIIGKHLYSVEKTSLFIKRFKVTKHHVWKVLILQIANKHDNSFKQWL